MENCLVTKLKGVVDNDNLNIYGAIKIEFHSGNYDMAQRCIAMNEKGYVDFISTKPVDIYDSTTIIMSQVTQGTISNEVHIVFPNDEGNFFYKGKYDTLIMLGFATNHPIIGSLSGRQVSFKFNASDLDYSPTLRQASSLGLYGKLDLSLFPNLYTINVLRNTTDSSLIMNIDDAVSTNLDVLYFEGNSGIKGNVRNLGKETSLLALVGTRTGLYGDIKEMVDGMVSNGRTSGTLTVSCLSDSFGTRTWNGEILTSEKVSELTGGHSLFRLTFTFNSSGYVIS